MEPSSQNPNPTAPPNANRISIVTKSEIRYEGVLYHINPQDQNITLCNVKSFGTEGRRPGDEIGPSPQVHEYIIFRGTDIKDLKVLEESKQQQAQPETQPVKKPEQNVEQTPAPREQNREAIQPEKSMKRGENQEDFDFQAMRQKFQEFASEHKPDVNVKTYHQDDFFDNLSTSTADKAREQPFDRIAQKKTDKETFGSEYVDTATSRGRGRYGRGGGRGGYNRGGYNRGGGYHGGQNRNYGGQNRNYEGQQRNYEGGQQRNYEGGQQRNYEGGQQRNYGGQQRNYGQNRGYGNQNRQYDNQGGYNQGGYNQGGYNQRKYGDQDNRQQRGEGGYQSGPRYYKNYQESGHNQDQGGDNRGDNRENKNF